MPERDLDPTRAFGDAQAQLGLKSTVGNHRGFRPHRGLGPTNRLGPWKDFGPCRQSLDPRRDLQGVRVPQRFLAP